MSQTTMLSQPRRFNAQTRALPMKPAPPVTSTRASEKSFGFMFLFWQRRLRKSKKTSALVECKNPTSNIWIIYVAAVFKRKHVVTNHDAFSPGQNRLYKIFA